jgi:hypothetical protein
MSPFSFLSEALSRTGIERSITITLSKSISHNLAQVLLKDFPKKIVEGLHSTLDLPTHSVLGISGPKLHFSH